MSRLAGRGPSCIAVLMLALGISPTPAGAEGESFEEVMASPALLMEHARAAVERERVEHAFRTLALLRQLYPDSEESASSFELACGLFKPIYRLERLARPDSSWATSDPILMFSWAASYFVDDQFPQEKIDALLRGMPTSYAGRFVQFAKRRHASAALKRWELSVEEDNGRVTRVTARLAAARS